MSGQLADEPLGYLVVADSGGRESRMPIFDQLLVGRECAGVSPQRRLVIDNPRISRNHLEIRLDADSDRAFVMDTSTNGARLNGLRLERAVPMPIKSGDKILIGDLTLTFESAQFRSTARVAPPPTEAQIDRAPMVMVVGDIINYSTIAEVTDPGEIAASLNHLWQELGHILRAHQGTLNHYAGDAICAIWELSTVPDAMRLATEFALAANERVNELGPELSLRSPQGSPIQMGWAVVLGVAAVAAMTRAMETVIGDPTNVAFRLAGLAGRDGRPPVMVTNAVHDAVKHAFVFGESEQVKLKGRTGLETVFPVIAQTARA